MKLPFRLSLLFASLFAFSQLQAQLVYKDHFAHTYSIVARDTATGEMAVAVQSHYFGVGSLVTWGKSGVGVVATQSFVNPSFGPNGLQLMQHGKSADQALNILIAQDEGKDVRQVAFLDKNGVASAYTGSKCIAFASQITEPNFSVQANMMLNDKVVPAMAAAFKANANLPLAERMVKVLFAAQEAGGDIRGKQSAALMVVAGAPADEVWQDKLIDLRIDDHPTPLKELDRLLRLKRAYAHLDKGDVAVTKGNMELALNEYASAEKMFPNNLEMKFWKAVTMANNGLAMDALPIFKKVFKANENWRELIKRLADSGLLEFDESTLKQILKQ